MGQIASVLAITHHLTYLKSGMPQDVEMPADTGIASRTQLCSYHSQVLQSADVRVGSHTHLPQ